MRFIVTGGAGFIGSALVRRLVGEGHDVLNIDKLTYAGDLRSIASCDGASNYQLLQADIGDRALMKSVIADFMPDRVMHLAAESHVDRSIDGPATFIETNVLGTFSLLEAARCYMASANDGFRFLHVSTDEVYGSLDDEGAFTEQTPYAPNSPYSASKASSDHLVRAWHSTYGVPAVVSNCSNNYGPFQNVEKLIPTVIRSALAGREIPVYGSGTNVRDWIYVDDHIDGLLTVVEHGAAGQKYNLGGSAEISNIKLVRRICALLDASEVRRSDSFASQITFVADRPGHDFRYAIDSSRSETELGWRRRETLDTGLGKTVGWYLVNQDWLNSKQGAERLGLAPREEKTIG